MVTRRHPRLLSSTNSQAHVLPCLHSLLSLPAGFMTYHVLYFTAFTQFYLPTKCCLFLFLFPSKSLLPCSSSPASSHSSGVNESRQVLQEQPDFAQSLLREPNTPVIRKSRGTSTQVSPQTQLSPGHCLRLCIGGRNSSVIEPLGFSPVVMMTSEGGVIIY